MTVSGTHDAAQGETIERTIDVQGIPTHLFEAGSPEAAPLLYLHGTHLGNLWLEFHHALAQQFHVFALDIPGFGLTERPDWMRDMSDYVLYLRDLLNTLEVKRAHLVGHSLGGWMAAEVAVWYPERVHKLVLSNAAGIRVKGSPIGDLFAMNPQETVAVCFENLMAAGPLMTSEVNIDFLIKMYNERMTLATLAWNPSYDPKLPRRLERMTCPTLVIWGEQDRLIPAIYGEAWQKMIPGSRLVMLEGTGHMPMFEKHEEWAREITAFLQEEQEGARHE